MIIFIVCIIALSTYSLKGQNSLRVNEIDISKYPEVGVQLVQTGESVGFLDTSNLYIKLKGEIIKPHKIICEKEIRKESISSGLVIDVSGSMFNNDNIGIAKSAASLWINELIKSNIPFECSITKFNHSVRQLQPFTNNFYYLDYYTGTLYPDGGTSYEEAFFNPKDGILNTILNAKYKKVIVFLTDGLSNIDESKVIQICKKYSITVHCLILGEIESLELKKIALNTGGTYMNNIQSKKQAEDIYRKILNNETLESMYCKVFFKAKEDCENLYKLIHNNKEVTELDLSYELESKEGRLYIPNKNLNLVLEDGGYQKFSATMTAKYNDIQIDDINFSNKYIEFEKDFNYMKQLRLKIEYKEQYFTVNDTINYTDTISVLSDSNNKIGTFYKDTILNKQKIVSRDITIKKDSILRYYLPKDSSLVLKLMLTDKDDTVYKYNYIGIKFKCKNEYITVIRGEMDVPPPPQIRSGFGTLALLGNLETKQLGFSGFNSGAGIQLLFSEDFAIRLSIGINNSEINIFDNDIDYRYNNSTFLSLSLKNNLLNNSNLATYIIGNFTFTNRVNGFEYIDDYKRLTTQMYFDAGLGIGTELFMFHNLSLSAEYLVSLSMIRANVLLGRNKFREIQAIKDTNLTSYSRFNFLLAFYIN